MKSPARSYVTGLALVYAAQSYQNSFRMFSIGARVRFRSLEVL